MIDLNELDWICIEFQQDGQPILLRYREFPSEFQKDRYPDRLNIFWNLREPTDVGLPFDYELDQQQAFEDRLVEAVENDHHSVLSLIMCGKNQKEYIFHTPQPSEFMRRLNEMPQDEEPYPIEIYHNPDPDWDYVRRVVEDLEPEGQSKQRRKSKQGRG